MEGVILNTGVLVEQMGRYHIELWGIGTIDGKVFYIKHRGISAIGRRCQIEHRGIGMTYGKVPN